MVFAPLAIVHLLEELPHLHVERPSHFVDVFERQIRLPSFDGTHVGAMNLRSIGEGLLGIARVLTKASNGPSESFR
jgi:hypothetical protein